MREPPSGDGDHHERRQQPEAHPGAVEVGDEPGVVGDEQKIGRASLQRPAAGSRNSAGSSPSRSTARRRRDNGDAFDRRLEPASGIGEHGPGDERRAAAASTSPIVNTSAEPTPGLSHSAMNQAELGRRRATVRPVPRAPAQNPRPAARGPSRPRAGRAAPPRTRRRTKTPGRHARSTARWRRAPDRPRRGRVEAARINRRRCAPRLIGAHPCQPEGNPSLW